MWSYVSWPSSGLSSRLALSTSTGVTDASDSNVTGLALLWTAGIAMLPLKHIFVTLADIQLSPLPLGCMALAPRNVSWREWR